ncbi:MAG: restriction endonuclease subunit S [Candidatus Binatia bacterium]
MKWRDSTLGKLTAEDDGLIQTGPFGSQLHQADYQPEGIPVIMPKDIADGRVLVESVARVSEETANRLERHKLKPRSIVLPRRGEVTKRAFIRAEQEGWLCGTGCLKIELSGKELVPEFLYYFMEQGHVVQWLEQHAVGTTMLNLSAGIVADLPIHYPAIEVQHEIADVLSSYDSLIENNLRRMKLLEESARLLYREWFVRLRFPGHEHTRIVNGVPEGWEKKSLSELTDYISRGIAPQYDDDAEGIVINQKCIRNGRLDLSLARHQSREFTPVRQVQVGDVLINSTGEGTLGRVAQVKAPIPNCTVDTHITIVRPKTGLGMQYFGMVLMEWESQFSTMGRGATNQTELSRATIGETEILIPTHALVQEFESYVDPISQQNTNLIEQNQKLKAARDLLLPKLMSGEIAV